LQFRALRKVRNGSIRVIFPENSAMRLEDMRDATMRRRTTASPLAGAAMSRACASKRGNPDETRFESIQIGPYELDTSQMEPAQPYSEPDHR
jgi:hypothetical protein